MKGRARVLEGGALVLGLVLELLSCKADLRHAQYDGGDSDLATGGRANAAGTSGSGGALGTGGMVAATGGAAGVPDAGQSASGGATGNGGVAVPPGSGGAATGGVGGTGGGSPDAGGVDMSIGSGGGGAGGTGAGGGGTAGAMAMDAGPPCVPSCPSDAVCQAGACVCPEGMALCSNTCVDIKSSPAHCGSCTIKCGDACSAGRCYKTIVKAPSSASFISFAVNASDLYFVDRQGGDLSRVPRGGGTATVLATGQYYAGPMLLDANALYWLDEGNVSAPGGVNKMPLSGGQYTALVTSEPNPISIGQDSTNVYWSDYSPHFVKKVPKAGGQAVVLAMEDNADRAANLITDDKNLYWTSLVGGGTVFKLPLVGGSTVPIASGITAVDNFSDLAVTRGSVYFLSPLTTPQHLLKVAVNGGAVTTVADTSGGQIVADDAAVYADSPKGFISRFDLDTGVATQLAEEPRGVLLMVVEGNDLFWMNLSRDIKSTAKKP